MANILEIKQEHFKIENTQAGQTLMLTGPPSKGASIVLFRPAVASQNAALVSKKELEIFKGTAATWDQNQRLGFFVIELGNSPKLVKSSISTNTNLSVACSICIFYYSGNPLMFLKKIPLDNSIGIRNFCLQAFSRIESSQAASRNSVHNDSHRGAPPTRGGYTDSHRGAGTQQQRHTYQPEGLSMPSMTSLRHTKDSYQEESLLVPPDIIPKNAPWMIEE